MKTVKIFGPSCKRCETTAPMITEAASDLGLEVAIEKVKDVRSIAMAGLMSTPSIGIDANWYTLVVCQKDPNWVIG